MIDNRPDPQTLQAAQYNIPFVLAVAAHQGAAGLLPLTEAAMGRPELVDFASRIDLEIETDYDAMLPERRPARVVLETSKGTFDRLAEKEDGPHDLETVGAKFRTLTGPTWSEERQAATIAAVEDLSAGGGVGELAALLRAAPDR
jgi:2-methylcitrate dehydratase PrpD